MGKKCTYEEVKKFINDLGYELISKEYDNSHQKLTLKDKDGYFYTINLSNIKSGKNAHKFDQSNPFTLINIKLWLKLNNKILELVSEKYIGSKEKLIFKDVEGFLYVSNFEKIRNGGQPNKFYENNPYTIQNINLWLKLNDLKLELITDKYLNVLQKLTFKDTDGYLYSSDMPNLVLGVNRGNNLSKFGNGNIYTIENIKLWLILNNMSNYQLIDNEYVNNSNQLTLKDSDGYLYYVGFGSIQQHHNPDRYNPSNPYTIQNIKLWCKLNNKPFVLISDIYNGNIEKLQWKCLKDDCKEIFKNNWSDIYQGCGCGVCDGRQINISNCLATKNPVLASEWHLTKNGDLTPYDVSVNSGKEAWWQCKDNPKHEWEATISNRNNTGCPYCSGHYASEDYNLLVVNPNVCEEWNYNRNDKRPDEYTPKSGKKVWWKCKECNNEWKTSIAKRNNGSGCPECNKSKGEKRCKEFFISRKFIEINQEDYDSLLNKDDNIYYVSQKEYDGLVGTGGGLLSYDFYLPKYNLLIEYQGEYHDQIILNYKGEPIELAEARLIKQKEHDKRKKEYAQGNEYNFLEIWYWDFDNIETILENTLINSVNNETTVEYNIEQMVQSH